MPIQSVDPASGTKFASYEALTNSELEAKIGRATSAFVPFRTLPVIKRAQLLLRAADILDQDREQLAVLITREMGKTLVSARAEVKKCALVCRYYAERGESFLANEGVATDAAESYICYQPLGVVLAIMPWNFPFWQVFRFAAPALLAGNVALLKHASNVPQCALAIEDALARAGFPDGVFQTLLIEGSRVEQLLKDPRVAAATITGSDAAGASVAAAAGSQIKKVVLELGGSDPFIVMESADVTKAAKLAVKARMVNNGQSCIAAKRFIVHQPVFEQFKELFVREVAALKLGNPMQEETEVGPLATEALRASLHKQVEQAIEDGATTLVGAKLVDGAGYFYAPTVLANLPRTSSVFHQELFGPVALLFSVSNITEAIDLANDSPFGLAASVWTNEFTEQEQLIREIEAGAVFVNEMVASDPRLPFGGIKRSGYGRELGQAGIREFVNIKTVVRA
jgi:succinate-semialdehyde dehydrogenase/glutarate-semialdehyde dehydrogenase